MKRLLLAIALVLAMAIPAMSAVQPRPMDIVVYYDTSIYELAFPPDYLVGSDPNFLLCGERVCVCDVLGCVRYEYVAKPMAYIPTGRFDTEIVSATIGSTYHVKGTIFSELPKNIKYQLIITKGITTLYKTEKIPVTPLNGSQTIQFEDFTFEAPGMYTFTLQVIRGNGTIVKVDKKVFVPAHGIVLEEGLALEEEPGLEESIGD